MSPETERRKGPRFDLSGKVVLRPCGLLVELEGPRRLNPGETVTVEIILPPNSEQPFSVWGIGKVVRADGAESAIELSAGGFSG